MSRSELSKELALAFQYVDDRYLDLTEQEAAPETNKFGEKRLRPVAACIIGLIIILALPAVAIAANWFGLKDLLLPAKTFIGLSGFQESPEAQALSEWRRFLDEYDPDQRIVGEIGNALTGFEDKYGEYTVYTQEMADRLEEIVQKYHLKLHTEQIDIGHSELADYVGGKFLGNNIDISMGYPYLYENGAFQFDGYAMLGESGSIGFQCRRSVKGTLDEVTLNIGNIGEYQGFRYAAACGESVVLALSARQSLIFADLGQCFVLLNILGGSENGVTEKALQEIADEVDFTVLKEVRAPDMAFGKAAGSPAKESESTGSLPAKESEATGEPPVKADGTVNNPDETAPSGMEERYKAILLGGGEFVNIDIMDHDRKLKLENIGNTDNDDGSAKVQATQFAVVDLDGNGVDEIVVWLQINGTIDYGYEILYYLDKEVYGFTLAYRQLLQLKADGSFLVSMSAADERVCKLQLSEGSYAIEEIFGNGSQEHKTDVEWHDLTEDNVEEQF